MGVNVIVINFHTIKSILNIKVNDMILECSTNFHTIKSILNVETPLGIVHKKVFPYY